MSKTSYFVVPEEYQTSFSEDLGDVAGNLRRLVGNLSVVVDGLVQRHKSAFRDVAGYDSEDAMRHNLKQLKNLEQDVNALYRRSCKVQVTENSAGKDVSVENKYQRLFFENEVRACECDTLLELLIEQINELDPSGLSDREAKRYDGIYYISRKLHKKYRRLHSNIYKDGDTS